MPLTTRGLFDPFQDLTTLQHRINRLFEDVFPSAERTELARTQPVWTPAVDIYEEPEAIFIEADLPGLTKDDVSVNLENNVLTIQGQRKWAREDQQDNYHRIERSYGSFTRSFTLPSHVNPEAIEAEFKDGVLRVRLPKLEQAKPRQIKVH
ncbi:MAG: Hsp20/alpha crystallin family protein [Acidobacteria bacterium]|nr:Hsp20/alpha crystallin family protein [Acidobacteriota bacterium]